jgi:hypothetical protein
LSRREAVTHLLDAAFADASTGRLLRKSRSSSALLAFHRTGQAHAAGFHLLAVLGLVMIKRRCFAQPRSCSSVLVPALLLKLLVELYGSGLLDLKLLVQPVELYQPGGKLGQLVFELRCCCRRSSGVGLFQLAGTLEGEFFLGLIYPGRFASALRSDLGLCPPAGCLGDAGMIGVALVQFLKNSATGIIIGCQEMMIASK